jgi:hypothetical protein
LRCSDRRRMRHHALPSTRYSPPAHTHNNGARQTAWQTANDNASSLKRRGCRLRLSRAGSRCRRNPGESRLPRSSPLLCACSQHAERRHWSHRSHPKECAGAIAFSSNVLGRDQDARGRASSGGASAGGARYSGLGFGPADSFGSKPKVFRLVLSALF